MFKYLLVDGISAAQTPLAVLPFKSILSQFDCIIEIGFHRGGFSKWLFDNKKIMTKLICYDITFKFKEVVTNNIDFRLGNCFDSHIISEIISIIEKSQKTLVLCDGGNKEEEFKLYSQYIKNQDVIMLHDYCSSNEEYEIIAKSISWDAPAEARYENIADCILKNKLKPYHYESFKDVLWGSFQKQL